MLAVDSGPFFEPLSGPLSLTASFIDSSQPESHAIADIDSDGVPDLIVQDRQLGAFLVYRNDGAGNFTYDATYKNSPGSPHSLGIAAADIDGDGALDVLFSNNDFANGRQSGYVRIHYNNGEGAFSPGEQILTGPLSPARPVLADVSGDGHLDILTPNFNSNSISVVLWHPNGHWLSPAVYPLTASAGSNPANIIVADFNGDNSPDLYVPVQEGGGGVVFTNDGSGGFGHKEVLQITAGYSATALDVDGDGDVDILQATNRGLTLLENNGAGSFAARVYYDSGSTATGGNSSVTKGRFTTSQTLGVLYSNSRGTVLLPTASDSAIVDRISLSDFTHLLPADLNSDGIDDIVGIRIAPALTQIWKSGPSSLRIDEDSPEITLVISGISAGDGNPPTLLYATSSDTRVIPLPEVDYIQGDVSGLMRFTPAPDASGTVELTVNLMTGGIDGDLSTPDDNLLFSRTVSVVVSPINDSPTGVSLANAVRSLPEDLDTSSRMKIADIVVEDDALGSNTLALRGGASSYFEIDGTTLYLRAGVSLDYETYPLLSVTVEAIDASVGGSSAVSVDLEITVIDVNEPPTGILLTGPVRRIEENTATAFFEDSFSSIDLGLWNYYNAVPSGAGLLVNTGGGAGIGTIESKGKVYFTGDFDVHISFNASENASQQGLDIALDIIAESAGRVQVVEVKRGWFSEVVSGFYDGESWGDWEQSATAYVEGRFRVRREGAEMYVYHWANDGWEWAGSAAGRRVSDAGRIGTAPVFVKAQAWTTPGREATVIFSDYRAVVPESAMRDAAGRLKVASIQPMDDALGVNSFSLSGPDASFFEIVDTDLYLKAGVTPDFEQKASYAVTVQAFDATVPSGLPVSADLVIRITDVNETPTAVTLTDTVTNLPENTPTASRIRVATISVADDALGTNVLSLLGPDAASFEVAGDGLFLKAGVVLDYETKSSYAVTVAVQDEALVGSDPATAEFVLQVDNVGEPPFGSVMTFDSDGRWFLGRSDGSKFNMSVFGVWSTGVEWTAVLQGDVNGDGLMDVIGRTHIGQWWATINQGDGTGGGRNVFMGYWKADMGFSDIVCADFNGDGRDDVAGRTSSGQWWIGLSRPDAMGFSNERLAKWPASTTWQRVLTGDFNGDGRDDIAGLGDTGVWWSVLGNEDGTGDAVALGVWNPSLGFSDITAGDFNGDGRTDIIGRTAGGQWWAAMAKADVPGFDNVLVGAWSNATEWTSVAAGDFNGDGKTDIVGRATNGQWWGLMSDATDRIRSNVLIGYWSREVTWTGIITGDADGDGREDIIGRVAPTEASARGRLWVGKVGNGLMRSELWGAIGARAEAETKAIFFGHF